MTYLNAQQLAFILDIKKVDARAKMCVAWSEEKGETNQAKWETELDKDKFIVKTGKLIDPYPDTMPIDVLSRRLNLPTLQQSVDDICNNYLSRPASKKWILFDYPEKQILKFQESNSPAKKKLSIPAVLRTFLKADITEKILSDWKKRWPKYV